MAIGVGDGILGLPPSFYGVTPSVDAQQAHAAQQAYAAQQAQTMQGPPRDALTEHNAKARQLFISRMGGVTANFMLASGDFMHTQFYNGEVYLFFLFSGKEGVVRESADVFPSDQLIAQFRMIVSA